MIWIVGAEMEFSVYERLGVVFVAAVIVSLLPADAVYCGCLMVLPMSISFMAVFLAAVTWFFMTLILGIWAMGTFEGWIFREGCGG